MKYAKTLVFCLVFVTSIIVQWHTWAGGVAFDAKLWQEGAQSFADGTPVGPDHPVYGYPATTILVPAGALTALGKNPGQALDAVMIVELSLAIAAAALLAYILRPGSYWWAYTAFVLLLSSGAYQNATLPSALLIPLALLFALLVLLAYERKTLGAFIAAGVCGGVMLATRFETSAVLIATAALFLRLTSRRAFLAYVFGAAALGVFVILDPYLWHGLIAHLGGIFEKFLLHAEGIANPGVGHSGLHDALAASIVGLLSFCLAGVLLVLRKTKTLPFGFLAWQFGATAVLLATLLLAGHHQMWLFYPVLIPYEAYLLPLALDSLKAATSYPNARFKLTPLFVGGTAIVAYCIVMLIQVLVFEWNI